MCKNVLLKEKCDELDKYIDSIEDKEGNLISILHKAQEIVGYLPKEIQLHVSRKVGIPAAKVFGVVTFYSFFKEQLQGEHVINVCLGTACFVKGSETILSELEKKLGIKAGQTSEDGKYSLDAIRCVGACGLAPVVIVDGKVYGRVTVEQIDKILENTK